MDYKQALNQHAVMISIKTYEENIEKIIWDHPEQKKTDDILKLVNTKDYIKKCISTANAYITPISVFDNINGCISNANSILHSYAANPASINIQQACSYIENAIIYTTQIVQKNNIGKNVVEIEYGDVLNNTKNPLLPQ
jgi:hypothetical protein